MSAERLTVSRILLWSFVSVVIVIGLVAVVRWRQSSTISPAIPFQPRLSYESSNAIITNTETEPYFDVSLHVYVDGTLYSAPVGTISPGETVKRPLSSLKNQRGENFDPERKGISELEVRARFKGYAVHKDFARPPR
jgi:hypothetical protein